jgi:hypothetical protein
MQDDGSPTMTAMLLETNILTYFVEMDDPRIEKNYKPPISCHQHHCLGLICGADTWVDIERYGNVRQVQ